jgi:hypothetical protein
LVSASNTASSSFDMFAPADRSCIIICRNSRRVEVTRDRYLPI